MPESPLDEFQIELEPTPSGWQRLRQSSKKTLWSLIDENSVLANEGLALIAIIAINAIPVGCIIGLWYGMNVFHYQKSSNDGVVLCLMGIIFVASFGIMLNSTCSDERAVTRFEVGMKWFTVIMAMAYFVVIIPCAISILEDWDAFHLRAKP
jgi:ethanolamine transporter EutH